MFPRGQVLVHGYICLLQPGQVPLMDETVTSSSLFPVSAQLRESCMLGEQGPEAPQLRQDSLVQLPATAFAADAPAEVQNPAPCSPAHQPPSPPCPPGTFKPIWIAVQQGGISTGIHKGQLSLHGCRGTNE